VLFLVPGVVAKKKMSPAALTTVALLTTVKFGIIMAFINKFTSEFGNDLPI
jgi:hypothetical protein